MNWRALLLLGTCLGARATGRETPRPSITFILGDDVDEAPPMYRLAKDHFQNDPTERTTLLIPWLRSLREVRDYLASQEAPTPQPWGVINLVVHGNDTGFLEVPVLPGGPHATATSLAEADFPPVPDAWVDAQTEIRIHGCSVGRKAKVLAELSRLFGGTDAQRPLVKASRWFTCFRSLEATPGPPTRSLCEHWELIFPTGRRPSDEALVSAFRQSHPKANVNLREALLRAAAGPDGQPFSYEAPLTFTWILVYPGATELPAVTGPRYLRKWLLSKVEFVRSLQARGYAYDAFQWEVLPSTYTLQGQSHPALKVVGKARALHVLRPLEV